MIRVATEGALRVLTIDRPEKANALTRISEVVALAVENIHRLATVSVGEASLWDDLHHCWTVERVNHSLA